MLTLDQIRTMLAEGRYELTAHALRRLVERNISAIEIRAAGASAELLEDYPTDKYGHSSLLLGRTAVKRPLHIHVARVRISKSKSLHCMSHDRMNGLTIV